MEILSKKEEDNDWDFITLYKLFLLPGILFFPLGVIGLVNP